MADTKISALETLAYAALTGEDEFIVVDKSDTSMAATGTSKRVNLVETGTWTPVITGSTSNPTVTYTIQDGVYTRIGRVVFYSFLIRINTISGGSGNVRVSLPSTAASGGGALSMTCSSYHINVDLPGSNIVGFRFSAISGAAYGQFSIDYDNSTPAALDISALGSNKSLGASGFYFV